MAELNYMEAREAGVDIGSLLIEGKVDDAKTNYAKMMQRIEQETEQTATKALKKEWLESSMEMANPTDVKGPGNGMDEGHYIYWNPEIVTSEVNNRIQKFCLAHGGCLSLAQGKSPQDRTDAATLVTGLNSYLDKALPDPLERHVFIQDFNRRRIRNDFQAFLTEDFRAQLYSPYSDRRNLTGR